MRIATLMIVRLFGRCAVSIDGTSRAGAWRAQSRRPWLRVQTYARGATKRCERGARSTTNATARTHGQLACVCSVGQDARECNYGCARWSEDVAPHNDGRDRTLFKLLRATVRTFAAVEYDTHRASAMKKRIVFNIVKAVACVRSVVWWRELDVTREMKVRRVVRLGDDRDRQTRRHFSHYHSYFEGLMRTSRDAVMCIWSYNFNYVRVERYLACNSFVNIANTRHCPGVNPCSTNHQRFLLSIIHR
jgi:hypothetical protein